MCEMWDNLETNSKTNRGAGYSCKGIMCSVWRIQFRERRESNKIECQLPKYENEKCRLSTGHHLDLFLPLEEAMASSTSVHPCLTWWILGLCLIYFFPRRVFVSHFGFSQILPHTHKALVLRPSRRNSRLSFFFLRTKLSQREGSGTKPKSLLVI